MVEPDRISPSPKSNFKNTDFIDVAPVVRTSKGGVTINEQEEVVEVKVEAGTSFEFAGDEQIVIAGEAASEQLGKYEEAAWESEAASEDAEDDGGGGGVVKLQPRVSFSFTLMMSFLLHQTLQDEKTLQAESLKEIKHKTKCKVCQGEFKNRQVNI